MASRLFVIVRAAFFASLFVALWTWFIPRWLAGGDLHPRWNAISIVLMTIGGLIMLRCVWDFAWRGRGTPAPWDPPRKLVVTGLYRWVRNPMYLGMAIFLIGEALLLPDITRELLIVLACALAVVTVFIMAYEEPTLRGLFGEDYVEYCRKVRRWIPRVRPFDNDKARA